MSERNRPMRRDASWVEGDMKLPDGQTCSDCVHFARCQRLFGHIAGDEVCDFSPSRFVPRGR